jgi:stage V sporulation protein AD
LKRAGRRTFVYEGQPALRAAAAVVGPKEGQGPLGMEFDQVLPDDLLGMDTWEKAESEMLRRTVELCATKAGMTVKAIDVMLAGDLQDQITASGFAARALGLPFFGLYGACSTFIQSMVLGGALVDGGLVNSAVCAASSHFCAAERQYRFPLELGNQRPPSTQWTATAAGAALIMHGDEGLCRLTHGTVGRIVDYQIKDANHMGAAMAPAVADTLTAHFKDTGRTPADYDQIVTGDLGVIGRQLLIDLMAERGIPLPPDRLADCGASLYGPEQDAHAGGSGCGCIASVLSAHFLPMLSGPFRRILSLGSGAMLSPATSQQGESIPSISYAVALEAM